MNFNLKEISTEEAEALPSGKELWAGQTRETAVKGEKVSTYGWQIEGRAFDIHHNLLLRGFGFKLYIPTPDAVDISPSEAAARMVNGLPVEATPFGGNIWRKLRFTTESAIEFEAGDLWPQMSWDYHSPDSQIKFRIPACPPAKQKLTIEVDAGVEVPDEFTIFPVEQKLSYLVGELATAKVIHREAK